MSDTGAAVEGVEPPGEALASPVLAAPFDGLFALPGVVPCVRGALAALRLGASSRSVAESAGGAAGLSIAAFVVAMVVFESATLAVGGAGREAVLEGGKVWLSTSAPPSTVATIVPKAMPK
jgi:hypothetical protein